MLLKHDILLQSVTLIQVVIINYTIFYPKIYCVWIFTWAGEGCCRWGCESEERFWIAGIPIPTDVTEDAMDEVGIEEPFIDCWPWGVLLQNRTITK